MKKLSILSFLLAVLTLTSCTQDELSQEQIDNDLKNLYTQAWIRQFGLIDSKQDWNMATSIKADVDPRIFGDDVSVKIYNGVPGQGGQLIGFATKPGTLRLDVREGTETLYAEAIDADRNVLTSGIYAISDGKASIDGKPLRKVASRGGDETSHTDVFMWMIACEDLGTTDDYDFNDIVLGINSITIDDKSRVTITPMAAGGTLEARISIAGEEIGEIHSMIDPSAPVTRMLNTTGFSKPGTPITKDIANWSMASNMGDIKIAVSGHGQASTTIITPPDDGQAPQMICISGDWQWPNERKSITAAYTSFGSWSQNSEMRDWLDEANEGTTIVWSIPAEINPYPNPFAVAVPSHAKSIIMAQGQVWSDGFKDCTNTDINNSPGNKVWDYVPGLVTKSMLTYCEQYNKYDDGILDWAKAYADHGYEGNVLKNNVFKKDALDNIASGKVLLSLYRMSDVKVSGERKISDADAEKYKAVARSIYTYLSTHVTDPSTDKSGYPRIAEGLEGAGGFYHKYSYETSSKLQESERERKSYTNQMWLDGLYMGAAFYAEYLYTFADKENNGITDLQAAWQEVYDQFNIIHTHTWNSKKQLNYHGWATGPVVGVAVQYDPSSFWAKPANEEEGRKEGCSQEFWARGIGWYFAALVDVLEYMPNSGSYASNYNSLVNIYKDVANGLLKYQRGNGVWYQLIQHEGDVYAEYRSEFDDFFSSNPGKSDRGKGAGEGGSNKKYYNYYEASASSMFTYGLLKGIRLGILTDKKYKEAAESAYKGLINTFINGKGPDGNATSITGICKSAGLGPATEPCRDGSIASYLVGYDCRTDVDNEGKGLGAFIFASLEWENYLKAKNEGAAPFGSY